MAFSSLCFYEKQVADNNWSDTPTYFLGNVALGCYCVSSDRRSFSSLRGKTEGWIWGSLCFSAEMQWSHTAVSSVSTEPARPAHSMRAGILNCPQGAQLLGSSRCCFWHSLYIFFLLKKLLQHKSSKAQFQISVVTQEVIKPILAFHRVSVHRIILFCSRESTPSSKPSQQEKNTSSEAWLLVRVYPCYPEAQFLFNWINRYPMWEIRDK